VEGDKIMHIRDEIKSFEGDRSLSDKKVENTSKEIAVGRPINGISINGLELLLTSDGNVMKFPDVKAAKDFLQDHGFDIEAIEEMTFLDAETETPIYLNE
jgi:hypothetical protein